MKILKIVGVIQSMEESADTVDFSPEDASLIPNQVGRTI